MSYRITVDMVKDDGSMGELTLTKDGVAGGQVVIYFDDMRCRCLAMDLSDAIKFLSGGNRGKLTEHTLPKWER